jgi:RNA-directed DNA polymerase
MSIELTASDDELRVRFFALQTREDIARLLDIDEKILIYHLYIVAPDKKYQTFHIPKKSGGTRQILAPINALKIIQRKLNQVLQAVYEPKPAVHGFRSQKSILTNAREHYKRKPKPKLYLNLDIQDFFPSINFGRVRGMFMAKPYKLNKEVATVLAQICCHDKYLPQGAPTSPIVANMLCAKLDSQLLRLAQENRCFYTRYADDLTFSTSLSRFRSEIATQLGQTSQVDLGDALLNIIKTNGFEVNAAKIRLQTRKQRQEVTGLTVNRFPNVRRSFVRQIRAMIHALEKYGDAAGIEYFSKHDKKHRHPNQKLPSFRKIILGKVEFLGMIRGKDDSIYLKFKNQLHKIDPQYFVLPKAVFHPSQQVETPASAKQRVHIYTEGKTDWKHIKNALSKLTALGKVTDLDITFTEFEDDTEMGDSKLLSKCEELCHTAQLQPVICIFDHDNPKIIKRVTAEGYSYKRWGNNVFSLALPIPDHRTDQTEICIEFFYKDEEIKTVNKSGRRLYISNEFGLPSGRLISDKTINCNDLHRMKSDKIKIIDNYVFNSNDQNIALSKNDFAEHILKGEGDFASFDVSEFMKIFDVIRQITSTNQ